MSLCRLVGWSVGWLVGRSVIISLKFGKLVTIYAPMYHLLFQQTSHWLREDRITKLLFYSTYSNLFHLAFVLFIN